MKAFKISHQHTADYLKWLLWFSIGLAVLYFALAINAYVSGEEMWKWITNIGIGVIWLASGIFQLMGSKYYFPEIILNDAGITYKVKKTEKLLRWNQINNINLNNNTIILRTESEDHEELNIGHLKHKELQTVKDRLRKFADAHDVKYASKY